MNSTTRARSPVGGNAVLRIAARGPISSNPSFWITSGLPTIRKSSRGVENQNSDCAKVYGVEQVVSQAANLIRNLRRGGTPHANKFSIFTGNSRTRTPVA